MSHLPILQSSGGVNTDPAIYNSNQSIFGTIILSVWRMMSSALACHGAV